MAARLPAFSTRFGQNHHHITRKAATAPDCEITIEGRVLNFDAERIMLALMLEQTASQLVFSRLTANPQENGPHLGWPNRYCVYGSLVKRDRAAVVCDLLFGLPGRMRKPGEKIWLLPAISVSTARSLCAQCPAQYTAGQSRGKWRTTVPSPAERRDLYLQGCDLWTMPVGAASVTATGAVPHATQSL